MATYKKLTTAVPSDQRVALITDVAVGDQIDITDVLGRPAKSVRFFLTDAADVLEVKLNNLLRLKKRNESQADETVLIWSDGAHGSTYTYTGSLIAEVIDTLHVSSIEVVGLTLSSGTTIEIVVA